VRDALLALRAQTTTAKGCLWWCGAIGYLAENNPANQQLFGTEAVRDALVAVQPFVTGDDACLEWCSVILSLSCAGVGDVTSLGASPATRRNLQLLRVGAVRDAHADLKSLAMNRADVKKAWIKSSIALVGDEPAAPAAENLQSAIDRSAPLAAALLRKGLSEEQIVQDNWPALFLLPQDAVRAIMALSTLSTVHFSASGAVDAAMTTLGKLELFNAGEPTFERYATLDVLKVKPSSPLSCEMWCRVVARLTYAEAAGRLLGTAAVRDALVAMRPQATTADACAMWCKAMCHLTTDRNMRMFGTTEVRDALVALGPCATTADSCSWWCRTVSNIGGDDNGNANQRLFGTAGVRDAFVAVQPFVTTPGGCEAWCSVIVRLTVCNQAVIDANAQLFGTAAVRDALVAVRRHATTAAACYIWCSAMNNLAVNRANQQLLGTAAVRDALVAVQPHATTADTCVTWCSAINNLTVHPANQQLLGTAAVRDALVALALQATTDNACESWCSAVFNLTANFNVTANNNIDNQRLFCVRAVREAHAALQYIAASDGAAKKRWDALAEILC
jgi:hypothetical protein